MDSDSVSALPSSEERLMAALAHFMGAIVALVIWTTQKDKSRFVRFQTLQALAFDALIMVVSVFTSFCITAVVFFVMFASMFTMMNDLISIENLEYFFIYPSLMPFGIFVCVLPFSFVIFVIRLIAAGSVLGGRDFRYPVLGRKVESFSRLP